MERDSGTWMTRFFFPISSFVLFVVEIECESGVASAGPIRFHFGFIGHGVVALWERETKRSAVVASGRGSVRRRRRWAQRALPRVGRERHHRHRHAANAHLQSTTAGHHRRCAADV